MNPCFYSMAKLWIYAFTKGIINETMYVCSTFQGSTMWLKHSNFLDTFVKCEWKFCIDRQMASWYFWNIFIPSSIVFFIFKSDLIFRSFKAHNWLRHKVLNHVLLTLTSDHDKQKSKTFLQNFSLKINRFN